MSGIAGWRHAAAELLARLSLKERILLVITAIVVVMSLPMACVALTRGDTIAGLVLAGAPLLPMFRSTEILASARRRD
jgi:hypothetical protein